MLFCALVFTSSGFGQTWTQTGAPLTNWSAVACSADGSNVFASADGIYVSTNNGASWTRTGAESAKWVSVACAGDGSKVVAATEWALYASTNRGASWTQGLASVPLFWRVACSGDGTKMMAASQTLMHGGGAIRTSADSGATWDYAYGEGYWIAVACSADGMRLVSVANNPLMGLIPLVLSADFGATWTSGPADFWQSSLACSADGRHVFAGTSDSIHISSDYGSNWVRLPNMGIGSLACSADGSRVIGVHGAIYTSADSGATWVSNSVPVANWSSVACSADGSRLFATVNGGGIYTFQSTPAPALKIRQSGNSVLVSWIVPSMEFDLQESSDLRNWSGVGVTPVLNYTNLHHEVSVPVPPGPRFYRLATP